MINRLIDEPYYDEFLETIFSWKKFGDAYFHTIEKNDFHLVCNHLFVSIMYGVNPNFIYNSKPVSAIEFRDIFPMNQRELEEVFLNCFVKVITSLDSQKVSVNLNIDRSDFFDAQTFFTKNNLNYNKDKNLSILLKHLTNYPIKFS